MRISSLARKIKIKPSELITFCEQNGIELDSGAHTKLTPDQVEKLYTEFAPEFLVNEDNSSELPVEEAEEISEAEDELKEEVPEIPDEPVVTAEEAAPLDPEPLNEPAQETNEEVGTIEENEPNEEEIEVIRAPKVTLPGLKVKGKIELPEPKKPEPKEEKPSEEKNKTGKRSDRSRKSKKKGDDYNPIAAARKRRQEKEEKERKAALNRKKKAKAKHYYKMQQKVAKTKQVKEKPDNKSRYTDSQGKEIQGNIFQRFWRWFNS